MKLVVIGIGQCGGRVADEFASLNKRSRSHRAISEEGSWPWICPSAHALRAGTRNRFRPR